MTFSTSNAMPVAAFILYRTFCLLLSIGKDASKITCICCTFIICSWFQLNCQDYFFQICTFKRYEKDCGRGLPLPHATPIFINCSKTYGAPCRSSWYLEWKISLYTGKSPLNCRIFTKYSNLNDFSNLRFSRASDLFAFYLRGNDYGLLQTHYTCFLTSESLCKAVGGHAWGTLKPENFIYRDAGPAECGGQGQFILSPQILAEYAWTRPSLNVSTIPIRELSQITIALRDG